DQMLRLNIDLQFDVVRCDGVDVLLLLKILAKQLSRHARGIFSRIEITLHRRDYLAQRTQSAQGKTNDAARHRVVSGVLPITLGFSPVLMTRKKTGRKIYSPPGLKLGVVTPKKFGAVSPALGLMPLFLRCFFLCCFLFRHRLIPPFQSATRGNGEELGMTSLNCVQ